MADWRVSDRRDPGRYAVLLRRDARWATILYVGAAARSVLAGVILAQQVILRS